MTTSESNHTSYVIGGFVALSSLAIGFVGMLWWQRPPSDDGPPPSEVDLADELHSWTPSSERRVDIRVDDETGPVWHIDETRLPLTPLPDLDRPLDWSHRTSERLDVLVGRSQWQGHPVIVRWAFAKGNPQARMSLEIREVAKGELELPLSGEMTWPEGTISSIDRQLRQRPLSADHGPRTLSAWSPTWLQWTRGDRALTLTRWTGDGLTFTSDDEGRTSLEFHLWRPDRHPMVERCGDERDDSPASSDSKPGGEGRADAGGDAAGAGSDSNRTTHSIRADALFVFGEVPLAAPWRYPDGGLGAVAPVFDHPAAHPDRNLHTGAPPDLESWLRRARTVLYGHSDTKDPRFGNGGLLGHGLGGSIALPADFAGHDVLREFRHALESTRAEVSLRDRPVEGKPPFRTLLLDERTCDLRRGGYSETPELIVERFEAAGGGVRDMLEPRASLDRPSLSPPVAEAPVSAVLPELDGSRAPLVEAILTGPELRALVERRGLFAFATPLMGSRNPLTAAARESLISPERHGHWTLSEPFATALANLSVMQEAVPIVVTSPADVIAYWRRARRVEMRWREDGGVKIHNPTDTTLRRATFVVGRPASGDATSTPSLAETTLSMEETSLRGTRHTSRHGSYLWGWKTLDPGTTQTLQFEGGEDGLQGPTPVHWNIRGDSP